MINSPPLAISRTLVGVATIAALVAAFIIMEGCSTSPVAPTSASVSGTQQPQAANPGWQRPSGRIGGAVRSDMPPQSQAANPDWQRPSGRIGGAVRGDMPQPVEIEPPRPFLCCKP